MSTRLNEGDPAPDFSLRSQDGKEMTIHGLIGRNIVVFFYPKDFTMGCTAETRAFGENYSALTGLGAEVIGISSDSTDSHEKFAAECGVSFPLLSDEGGKVRELYGVKSSMGLFPGRVTFVIDRKGVVRKIFASQLSPKKHVSQALDALRSLEVT
jgi:peroxiredoxin Q/BCP